MTSFMYPDFILVVFLHFTLCWIGSLRKDFSTVNSILNFLLRFESNFFVTTSGGGLRLSWNGTIP